MESSISQSPKALKECCSVCGVGKNCASLPGCGFPIPPGPVMGEAGLWQTLECTKETWGVLGGLLVSRDPESIGSGVWLAAVFP